MKKLGTNYQKWRAGNKTYWAAYKTTVGTPDERHRQTKRIIESDKLWSKVTNPASESAKFLLKHDPLLK